MPFDFAQGDGERAEASRTMLTRPFLLALLFLSLLLLPGRVSAAVAFDAKSTAPTDVSGATSPQDHTAMTVGSGSNRALIVQLGWGITNPGTVTVTWDQGGSNQAMTQIVAWTGGTPEVIFNAVSWTGVDQTGGTTSFPNSTSATTSKTTCFEAVGHGTVGMAAWRGMRKIAGTGNTTDPASGWANERVLSWFPVGDQCTSESRQKLRKSTARPALSSVFISQKNSPIPWELFKEVACKSNREKRFAKVSNDLGDEFSPNPDEYFHIPKVYHASDGLSRLPSREAVC